MGIAPERNGGMVEKAVTKHKPIATKQSLLSVFHIPPNPMLPFSTDNLADLIDKRHRCLLQLRDLGTKQSELIAAGEMGPLLRLIGAKNQLIAALQTIEKDLAPFHGQDPESRSWPTSAARAKCAEQAGKCQRLLAEVMELERQNEQNMIARRDQVATQLQTAQSAGAARGAYQAHQRTAPSGPHSQHASTVLQLPHDHSHRLDLHSEA